MKIKYLLLVACLSAFLLAGCSSSSVAPMAVGQEANNTTVTITPGQILNVALPSTASTGYKWMIVNTPDSQYLETIGDNYKDAPNGAPGQQGTETWIFEGIKQGQTKLGLVYAKPFDPTSNPGPTYVLTVSVQ